MEYGTARRALRRIGAFSFASLGGFLIASAAAAAQPDRNSDLAQWLYPVNAARATEAVPDPNAPRRVPGSKASYTNAQVDNVFIAPDWHPEEHAPAPRVVSHGRPPKMFACGYCHRITGSGAPENAHLAGLSEAYIRQQLEDFRSGVRRSSHPERIPQTFMTVAANSLSDAEIDTAARYFAAQPPTVAAHVVESNTAPKVHVENWALTADRPIEEEPLGHRLLELADDQEDFKSRDTRASFTVFVPVGSVARGQLLANSKGPQACTLCHGQDLRGRGMIPSLVGQSPTYLLRQLVDFGQGARRGPMAGAMSAIAGSMSIDDMIAVAAYAASLGNSGVTLESRQ